MADKEFLGDRRRSQEEEYFHKREQELVANVRRRREATDVRNRLIEHTGITDDPTLDAIESLGFTPDTIVLLDLVPMIKVAWAEGCVSDKERMRLIEIARTRGVAPNSFADLQLESWLTTPPPDAFLDQALYIIGVMLQNRSSAEREPNLQDLLEWSRSIASASGGVLGFGKVSAEEEAALDEIRERLTSNRQQGSS
jgi:hypothetical protein